MRTQQEILNFIKNDKTLFGTLPKVLVPYLEFELAKPYIKEEYLEKIAIGEIKWEVATNPKKKKF